MNNNVKKYKFGKDKCQKDESCSSSPIDEDANSFQSSSPSNSNRDAVKQQKLPGLGTLNRPVLRRHKKAM